MYLWIAFVSTETGRVPIVRVIMDIFPTVIGGWMVTWNDDLRMTLSAALTTNIIDSSDESMICVYVAFSLTGGQLCTKVDHVLFAVLHGWGASHCRFS